MKSSAMRLSVLAGLLAISGWAQAQQAQPGQAPVPAGMGQAPANPANAMAQQALPDLEREFNAAAFSANKTLVMPTLSDLMSENARGVAQLGEKGAVARIRGDGIREAAASLGARGGLARKMQEYQEAIKKRESELDRIFNFSKVVLETDVLPPVIEEGRDADAQYSDDEMRIADRVFRILKPARLVPVDKKTGFPAVPNWREYLLFTVDKIQMPHSSLIPKNDAERAIWDEWVSRGWQEGEEQGRQMFDANWARLKRDFHGMVKYYLAYSQGLASRPVVARTNMGVTGGGREMRINDQVKRITDHSSLNADPAKWSSQNPQ